MVKKERKLNPHQCS